jgi:hypothetical protein
MSRFSNRGAPEIPILMYLPDGMNQSVARSWTLDVCSFW